MIRNSCKVKCVTDNSCKVNYVFVHESSMIVNTVLFHMIFMTKLEYHGNFKHNDITMKLVWKALLIPIPYT